MHEDEEYDFEYDDDDDDDGDEQNVDLENEYYRAKGRKEDDVSAAIEDFLKVVEKEGEPGEWGFKALKQAIKLSFKMQKLSQASEYYQKLLTEYTKVVTKNYAEKSINNLLDYVGNCNDMFFLEKVYSITLEVLESNQNERLSVKTNLKLAKLWLDRNEYSRMMKIIRKLRESLADGPDTDDGMQKQGTHLLEIYALEIQMYTETKNNKKLKELYQQCLAVKAAIPHPRIMGIVYECGGKMHMNQKEWDAAQQDFFEAFKNFDEAGSPQRINCLKYLVLANMLSESEIDPFDSQEAKPYKTDSQIVAMTNLVQAYQFKDIWAFEKVLSGTSIDLNLTLANSKTIIDDPFIKMYIDNVLTSIRSQVLIQLVKPYRVVNLDFLAKNLGFNVTIGEIENLLIALILEQKISGRIDQISQKLYMDETDESAQQIDSLLVLANALDNLQKSLFSSSIIGK